MMLKRFFTKPLELLSTYPTCAAPATTPLEVESKGFVVKVVSVTSFSIRLILLFFTSFHYSSSRYFAHHSLGKVCGLAPSSRVHFVFSLVLTFRTEIALYGLDCKSSSIFSFWIFRCRFRAALTQSNVLSITTPFRPWVRQVDIPSSSGMSMIIQFSFSVCLLGPCWHHTESVTDVLCFSSFFYQGQIPRRPSF